MPIQSVEDQLREQFYAWERLGRGAMAWEVPIHQEPPFRPFPGHFAVFPQVPDDGRRPTLLSRAADLFRFQPSPSPVALAVRREESEELPPPKFLEKHPLRRVILHVPRGQVIKNDVMAAVLMSLRAARYPMAFEIVGANGVVGVQLVSREPDERILQAALRSHFPDVTAVPGDLLADAFARDDYGVLGVFEFGLRREFMLPLGTLRSFDPDPIVAFVAALEETEDAEGAAFQVLFEPARAPWAESIFRAVTDGEGGDFFTDAPEIARFGKQKAMQPLFAASIRLAVIGNDVSAARERLTRLSVALSQFESEAGNQFMNFENDESYDRHLDLLLRQSHRSGMLLGLDELLSLVHLPSASVQSPALIGRADVRSRPLRTPESRGLYLGLNRHAGSETPVYLSLDRARRHVHIVGASGSGKSNLLLQLLLEDVKQGGGIALLDPHGDLVDELLVRIPEERTKDVILLDPADTQYPVGFNVLAAHSDLEKTLLASDLVAIFRRLSTSWGDQMHAVLANAIQAFLESERGGTIAELRKFLVDREFREEFLSTIPDEETTYYWRKEFPLLKGRPQGPILTRLDSFLRPKLVRQLVAQRENRIDFRAVMDGGKIFLAKLAQGAIGEENAALLGSFLVARLHQTAMSRQNIDAAKRRPFLIAADECQHFVTPSMASILSGARKYSVGLVLAHQDLAQLQRRDGEVFSSLSANAGTRIVFRVGDADARSLAEGFAHFTAEDLRALPTGEAICRYDRSDHDFNLAVPLVEPVDERTAAARRDRIVNLSRNYYATPPLGFATENEGDEDIGTETFVTRTSFTPAVLPVPEVVSPPAQTPPSPPVRAAAKAAMSQEAALGRGGPQHKYLQELVKRFGEAQGYHATIEKPTANGGNVDVALEHADGSIAVEISVTSTTKYESSNVAKCLAAGYARVVVLSPERRRLDAIAKVVRTTLLDSERSRVDFLLPEEFLTQLAAQTPPQSEAQVGGYKVKVSYKRPTDVEAQTRQRAVTEVIARSVKKLDP